MDYIGNEIELEKPEEEGILEDAMETSELARNDHTIRKRNGKGMLVLKGINSKKRIIQNSFMHKPNNEGHAIES